MSELITTTLQSSLADTTISTPTSPSPPQDDKLSSSLADTTISTPTSPSPPQGNKQEGHNPRVNNKNVNPNSLYKRMW